MIMFDRKQTMTEKILSYIAGVVIGADVGVKCSTKQREQAQCAYELSLRSRTVA